MRFAGWGSGARSLLVAALMPLSLTAQSLEIERADVFFVGGKRAALGVGRGGASTQIAGQSLVHRIMPVKARDVAVVMYPGLGLSSYIYLTTPDGREGWSALFAREGFPVYVFDPPNTGPSGLAVAPFNDPDANAGLTIWGNEMVWSRWGFGPEPGTPHPNARFPVDYVDQFLAAMPPRAGGGRGGGRGGGGKRGMAAAGPELDNFIELLENAGRSVIVLHSAAGGTGFRAAAERPELVAAVVVIEPVGCPRDAEHGFFDAELPFLAVYGDYIRQRRQSGRLEACRETARISSERGTPAKVIVLPDEGVEGNSHILMQDDNNAEIAGLIISWIAELR